MKTKTIILIIIAAMALGIGLYVGPHQRAAESPKERKILYYRNPMDPSVTSPTFMKDSMGMDYIPVYEEQKTRAPSGVQGYATISVTAQRQQLIGLRTQAVEVKPVVKLIRTFGTVASNAELYKTQSEFIDAYVADVNAYRDYKRIRGRQHVWEAHRETQVALLETKDKLLKLGLSDREIVKLQNVSWNQIWKQPKLLLFNDSRSYWVIARIYEQDYGFVHEGQEAEVSIPAYHEKIKGIIRSVGGFIDPTTRSVTALIELGDYAGHLAANMLVDITISVKLGDALLVPREAVMDTGLRKIVFVNKADSEFEPREIQTGWETGDGFEVKSGLKEGERIVVSGNFLLDSESRVQGGLEQGDSHGQ